MGEKKLRDFAKTKHEGLPEKVKEEMEGDSDDKKKKNGEEEDPRSMKTKVNLVKNKLRAMGLKMSYEPEGEMIGEQEYTVITQSGERKSTKEPVWKASPAAAVQPIETTGPRKSLPFPRSSRFY